MMKTVYRDRHDAGKRLAELLSAYAHHPDVLILALPRGGVPVAYEVARTLNVPLDVFIVRKLGVPGHEELALGAIASGGIRVLNYDVIRALHIPEQVVEDRDDEQIYRDGRPAPDVSGRTVILIDDGLATGATMHAALRALRQQQPARLIAAVPVAAPSTCLELIGEADDIICALRPDPFFAVGLWYQNFEPTSDQEVHDLLVQVAQGQHIQSRHQNA